MVQPDAESNAESITAAARVRNLLRAPAENGGVLMVPPGREAPTLLARNLALRSNTRPTLLGRPLDDLARRARAEIVQAALRFTAAYRTTPAVSSDAPLLMAGHQPQLFHPGVWLKNFVLDALAHRSGSVAVNLIVDGDTVGSPRWPIVAGSRDEPHRAWLRFDADGDELPWEERRVVDRALWESVAARATELLHPLVAEPLIEWFWPAVVERWRAAERPGLAIAQARHQLEERWGTQTLELPQSLMCQTESFAWFVAAIVFEAARFRQYYNAALDDYRQAYGVRSTNHPAPQLIEQHDAIELPFWLWETSSPRRRAAFVIEQAGSLVLTDRHQLFCSLGAKRDSTPERMVATLAALPRRGIKLRSRALTTTLFARLLAGDLFVHGIGGGKYDEVTERLAARFFGCRLPEAMVVSGTLRLPIDVERTTVDEYRRVAHQLRSLRYQPERFLTGADSMAHSLVEEKRQWIATPPTRAEAKRRAREIARLNQVMQPLVAEQQENFLAERERLARMLERQRVLDGREYPFAWHAEAPLRRFLTSATQGVDA